MVLTRSLCEIVSTDSLGPVKIARDFQMICFYSYPEFVVGGFFLPSASNVFNFSIRTILQ